MATEVAIGASISGVRAMACHEACRSECGSRSALYSGIHRVTGGLVLVVADDPGMYSSQNEQDTRMVARAAQVPVLEPSDSQDAKDFVKLAYDISEKYDTPVF